MKINSTQCSSKKSDQLEHFVTDHFLLILKSAEFLSSVTLLSSFCTRISLK